MSRIDRVILSRVLGNIGVVLAISYGISCLLEGLNGDRFSALSAVGGPALALLAAAAAAARGVLDLLPLLVLIGAILGLLALQNSREMTIIKASGSSVWRAMRGPIMAMLLAGLAVGIGLDSGVTLLTRSLAPSALQGDTGTSKPIWLEERGPGPRYRIEASFVDPGGAQLRDVTVFMLDSPRVRIEAPLAQLTDSHWVFPTARILRSNQSPEMTTDYRLASSSTRSDLRAKLTAANDQTAFELGSTLGGRLTDPAERPQALTRFLKLVFLPLTLAGTMVLAFAFTANYQRTNKYGRAVLSGIGLGFVFYVVAEMASRAAYAGVLQPGVAALGPSLLALVAGMTVLLFREDGRT